ncbi:MAG: alcohol dehydrogenase catalytic domain-containing protein [Saccharofermentanales bacterium]|jgi:2-desacetyl-2-hydroxyethyl bacteriochlorophyllide A dehydrogenase
MKQVFLAEPLTIKTVEIPFPTQQKGWVLAKTMLTGICGSDVKSYYGETIFGNKFPFHIGHEVCAIVTEVDSNNLRLRIGDAIVIDPIFSCGYCNSCFSNKNNNCEYGTTIGIRGFGGFSEYVYIPESSAFKINNNDLKKMVFAEPLSTVVYGYNKLKMNPTQKILIQGMGSIGLLFLNLAIYDKIAEIVVTDINNGKLRIASELGAKNVLNPLNKTDKAKLDNKQFDIIIDCTGSIDAIQSSIEKVAFGGQILIFGISSANQTILLSPFELYKKDAAIFGSHKSTKQSFVQAISLLEQGVIDTKRITDSIKPLSELEQSIIDIHEGKSIGKIIIDVTK